MSRYLVCTAPQGTQPWKEDRLGKVTGSNVAAIFAKVKTGEAVARVDYRMKLVLERLTGACEDMFVNEAMAWGTATEPQARMAFEAESGLMVREAGFLYLPTMAAGCSLDGFIDDEDGQIGIFETKSPKSKTHLEYLQGGVIPTIYRTQVVHNMWITGATFAIFQSFDPRFPLALRRFQIRIERNEEEITNHAAAVKVFLDEVDSLEQQLRLRAA